MLFLLGLLIYGLSHPVRHRVLLLLLGVVLGPAFLAFLMSKAGFQGMLEPNAPIDPVSIASALRRKPTFLILFPLVTMAVVWGVLLTVVGMEKGGDKKAWIRDRATLFVLWIMTPQVVTAYLCIVLRARYVGIYIAACLVYMTVTVAIGGLTLENGVVRFFGTYKAQASPLVILSLALICCASFGVLHFAIWSMWPSEYANMHGMEDALYFSVVTMATVGYGDILPVGHAARWLSVSEIMSGILLLVVGVSASMTIWLQKNQPSASDTDSISEAPTLPGNGDARN